MQTRKKMLNVKTRKIYPISYEQKWDISLAFGLENRWEFLCSVVDRSIKLHLIYTFLHYCLLSHKISTAKQYCALKKIQLHKKKSSLFQGRFRNHNDITGRSFYLCVDIYGSFCMPCAPGTVFRQSKHNKNNGGCVHAYSAQFIKW